MKLRFTSQVATLALFAMIMVIVSSCSKEIVEKQYPAELTIDNWQEFVDAPQELIDELGRKDREQQMRNAPALPPEMELGTSLSSASKTTVCGRVQAIGSQGWVNIAQVAVFNPENSCGAETDNSQGGDNYCFPDFCTDNNLQKCLEYATPTLNGVTTYDLVLIQRHVLNINPFTYWWQMCAADVNLDGQVTTSDIVAIQQVILGVNNSFPGVPAVRFAYEIPYNAYEDIWQNWGVYAPMYEGNCTYGDDFRAIKSGDVNASWTF